MNTPFQKRRTVVLLGDKGVGKTTLVKTLQQLAKATPTAGPSDIHEFTYRGTKIVIVDVAGDSRTPTPNTIRHAKIVLLTYDITNHETLDSCKYWHQFAQQNVNPEDTISYALVGCKSDLSDHERQVAWDTAERVSKMINASKVFEVCNTTTKNAQCIQLIDWVYGIIKEAAVRDDQINDGSVALGNATQTQTANNPSENKCWC